MFCRYCTWRGVRPCRSWRRVISAGLPSGACVLARAGGLDQPELHVLQRELALRPLVERLQHLRREPRLAGLAGDREALAAARDADVERGLDLAQVLVERAAQVGEPLVVDRA